MGCGCGARAALWCAVVVLVAGGWLADTGARAYTVDCNHEYTDCDTELSKLEVDEDELGLLSAPSNKKSESPALTTYNLPFLPTIPPEEKTEKIVPVTEHESIINPVNKPFKSNTETIKTPEMHIAEATEKPKEARLLNINVDEMIQNFANALHNQTVAKALPVDLSDVNMEEEDEDPSHIIRHDHSKHGKPISNKFYSNLQVPFNPLLAMDHTSEEQDSCKENGIVYKLGERVERACEETCECQPGGTFDCAPRCKHPYIRKGRRLNDPLCFESPVDECCSIIACATGNQDVKSKIEVCHYNNVTYAAGEKWHIGCEQTCSCEVKSVVTCRPRCKKLIPSEKCINVQDPNDECCEVQVCDVSQDVHEEPENATSSTSTTTTTIRSVVEGDLHSILNEASKLTTAREELVTSTPNPIGSVRVLQNNSVQVNLIHMNSSESPIFLQLSSDGGKNFDDVELKQSNLILNLPGGKDYILKSKESGNKFNFTITASIDTENDTVKIEEMQDGCYHDGKFYAVGEEYHIGCSELCECTGSNTSECVELVCPSHVGLELVSKGCVRWAPNPPAEPPNCCPRSARCLSDGTCYFKGIEVPNWTEVPITLTGCEQRCFCENGELDCQQVCSPLPPVPPQSLRCPPLHHPAPMNISHDDCCKQWGCMPNAQHIKTRPTTTILPTAKAAEPTTTVRYTLAYPQQIVLLPQTTTTEEIAIETDFDDEHYYVQQANKVNFIKPPPTIVTNIVTNNESIKYNPSVNKGIYPTIGKAENVNVFALDSTHFEPEPNLQDELFVKKIENVLLDKDQNFHNVLLNDNHGTTLRKGQINFNSDNTAQSLIVPPFLLPGYTPKKITNEDTYQDEQFVKKIENVLLDKDQNFHNVLLSNNHGSTLHKGQINLNSDDTAQSLIVPPFLLPGYTPKKITNEDTYFVPANTDALPYNPREEIYFYKSTQTVKPVKNMFTPLRMESENNEYKIVKDKKNFLKQTLLKKIMKYNSIESTTTSRLLYKYLRPYETVIKKPARVSKPKTRLLNPLEIDQLESQMEVESEINKNLGRSANADNTKLEIIRAGKQTPAPELSTPVHSQAPFLPTVVPDHSIHFPTEDIPDYDQNNLHRPLNPRDPALAGLPPGISLPPNYGEENKKLTVLSIQADSPTSIKLLFGLPPVLVNLRGSVDLRYTDQDDDDISHWYSQVFAPADEVLTTSRLEFRLTGLKPSTIYKIKGKLFLHNLPVEPESQVYSVRTLDPPTVMPPIEEKKRELDSRLALVDVNDTAAHVSWRHFTEDELQYIDGVQVRYRPVGTPIYSMTELLHHSRTIAELHDLRPGTKYEASLVLIPPPRTTAELYDPRMVEFTTAPFIDPYNWTVTIEARVVGSEAAELTWHGVPSPAERWVRVYRAAHACGATRHEHDAFRLAARDLPPTIKLSGLEANTRCRVWMELFLTNGKIKTSNVLEINTRPEESPEDIDNEIDSASVAGEAGARGGGRGDYYGALVVVGVVAALGALTSLLLLLVLVRRHRPRSVPITPVPSAPRESSLPPYDNPAYKLELQQETMDL